MSQWHDEGCPISLGPSNAGNQYAVDEAMDVLTARDRMELPCLQTGVAATHGSAYFPVAQKVFSPMAAIIKEPSVKC